MQFNTSNCLILAEYLIYRYISMFCSHWMSMISQTKWQTFSLSCVFVSAVLERQIAVCSLLLLPVCFLLHPDSIRGYKHYLKELSWLHFPETTDSVGNLVLSLCDSEPAALRAVIYTSLSEAREGCEDAFRPALLCPLVHFRDRNGSFQNYSQSF